MIPFIEAGSVKALAVSGDTRSPSLPQVPTMAEAGEPKYKAIGWFGLMAPATTPLGIVTKLSATAPQAAKSSDAIARLRVQGIEPASTGPSEIAALNRENRQ